MDKHIRRICLTVLASILILITAGVLKLNAQSQAGSSPATPASPQTPAAPAAPQPLPTPSMTAPLQTAVPHTFNAGPFGQVAITGIISGMGLTQGNWVPGDQSTHWDLSNGQVFLQKTTGWWQFYVQAGAYNIPALGTPFLSTENMISDLYGPLPTAYLKLVKGNFSVEIGELPTLIGAEYTFTFENMNIERGLLWNQENAINRGIQINDSKGKFSGSLSWNDGFYSNRYTWLTGSLSYAFNSANTLALVGGGNLGLTAFSSVATPVALNNSQIYNVIYTYSHEAWMVQPYFQYTDVPTNAKIGITQGASTRGGAVLVNYNFKHGISLAARGEYISSTGNTANGAVNLLYGPGSGAWSFTLTPTYQNHGFFIRGDVSVVWATNSTPGFEFGPSGMNRTQPRGAVEAGFTF
ncbi:MAG TPA: outer membrane beta-barrel protein [Terriglobia bacterium]|nr:outer membrane beta-barrel protein [Terriglobia bacterium]